MVSEGDGTEDSEFGAHLSDLTCGEVGSVKLWMGMLHNAYIKVNSFFDIVVYILNQKNMINLKKGVIVVNTARGPVVGNRTRPTQFAII